MTKTISESKQTGHRPRKRRSGRKKWLVLAVILAAAAVLVWRVLSGGGGTASVRTDYVRVQPAARTIVSSLTGSGTLQPANSYTVTTLVEGEVLTAGFEEGDTVEKDTVLYEIDSSEVANNIEKSEISLNQSRRSYENTADSVYVRAPISGRLYTLTVAVGDEVQQGQSIGAVRQSDTMLLTVPFPADDAKGFTVGQAAEVTLDGSFEVLSGTVKTVSGSDTVGAANSVTRSVTVSVPNPGALSDTQAATAVIAGVGCTACGTLAYPAERAVTASASGTVLSLQVGEGGSVAKDQTILTLGGSDLDAAVQNARESLRSAELSMESTRNQLDSYTITSPIRGTVVDKQYKAGDTVSGGKTLCTIYDLSYLEMTIPIDELDISSVAVGQAVRITAEAVKGQTYGGVITKVSLLGSTGSGGATTYPVTVRLREYDGLRPGMNADAEIVLATAEDVLSVPNEAVSRGDLVLVTADSPSAAAAVSQAAPEGYVYVHVEPGLSDDGYTQILSGLQEGDTVAYRDLSASSWMEAMGLPADMGGMGGGGGRP